MWLRAKVRAPAIKVEVVEAMSAAVVVESRVWRLRVNCSSTRRKGRYLFRGSSCSACWCCPADCWSFMLMSPSGGASLEGASVCESEDLGEAGVG